MKFKIVIEQIGKTAWTWEVRDMLAKREGGKGLVAHSGNDGEFGCFSTAAMAFADANAWVNLQKE